TRRGWRPPWHLVGRAPLPGGTRRAGRPRRLPAAAAARPAAGQPPARARPGNRGLRKAAPEGAPLPEGATAQPPRRRGAAARRHRTDPDARRRNRQRAREQRPAAPDRRLDAGPLAAALALPTAATGGEGKPHKDSSPHIDLAPLPAPDD